MSIAPLFPSNTSLCSRLDVERQQLLLKASATSAVGSNRTSAASAQLEQCLISQQRHALLPSDSARSNM